MGPKQVLSLWVRVDIGVIPMKEYSVLSSSGELEPHHQMLLSVILSILSLFGEKGSFPSARNTDSVF